MNASQQATGKLPSVKLNLSTRKHRPNTLKLLLVLYTDLERRRCAVGHAREKYEVSERHACRLLGQWRRTQPYAAIQKIDEEALMEAIVTLASKIRALRIPANHGAVAT